MVHMMRRQRPARERQGSRRHSDQLLHEAARLAKGRDGHARQRGVRRTSNVAPRVDELKIGDESWRPLARTSIRGFWRGGYGTCKVQVQVL